MAANLGPVLLIEGDRALRETLANVLRLEGFRVMTASNGREALSLLYNGLRPCIIVVDLMMPAMNGVEFREQLQGNRELASIPIIACAGIADALYIASPPGTGTATKMTTASGALVALIRHHCLKSDAETGDSAAH
jgi:CheY-like chemotaxis protein